MYICINAHTAVSSPFIMRDSRRTNLYPHIESESSKKRQIGSNYVVSVIDGKMHTYISTLVRLYVCMVV